MLHTSFLHSRQIEPDLCLPIYNIDCRLPHRNDDNLPVELFHLRFFIPATSTTNRTLCGEQFVWMLLLPSSDFSWSFMISGHGCELKLHRIDSGHPSNAAPSTIPQTHNIHYSKSGINHPTFKNAKLTTAVSKDKYIHIFLVGSFITYQSHHSYTPSHRTRIMPAYLLHRLSIALLHWWHFASVTNSFTDFHAKY